MRFSICESRYVHVPSIFIKALVPIISILGLQLLVPFNHLLNVFPLYLFHCSVDRNKYEIHLPLPPKIDPTVTMMQVCTSIYFARTNQKISIRIFQIRDGAKTRSVGCTLL